jgi:hypothetical protein
MDAFRAAAAIVVIGLVIEAWRRFRRASCAAWQEGEREARVAVTFDATFITVRYAGDDVRRVAWDELTAVSIRTTDEGPFVVDVYWGLHGPDGQPRAVYPGGAAGEGELLAEMQRRLAGFDNARLIEAMGSAADASFMLWRAGGAVVAA